ncbi:MAG: hypothetical protein ACI9YM_001179 [Brevundimonas sp.]|jgi:hypothetical protein
MCGLIMILMREIFHVGDRLLTEVLFVGVDGRLCTTIYEIVGAETLYFYNRREAEAGLRSDPVVPSGER